MTTPVAPTVRLRTQDIGPTSAPFSPGGGDVLVATLPAGRKYRREDLSDGSVRMWMLPYNATTDRGGLPSVAEIQRLNQLYWGDRNGRS